MAMYLRYVSINFFSSLIQIHSWLNDLMFWK